MVNKLWYNEYSGCITYRKFLKEHINKYAPNLYQEVEDITPDNVHNFLEIILKRYAEYCFHTYTLDDIGDVIEYYFGYAYKDEFPEQNYPNYSNDDRRSLSMLMISYFDQSGFIGALLPEDVPVLIDFLHTPDKKIVEAGSRMDNYFDQFDDQMRLDEYWLRWETITRQRKEALENNDLLPIRPMGITLNLCYKNR